MEIGNTSLNKWRRSITLFSIYTKVHLQIDDNRNSKVHLHNIKEAGSSNDKITHLFSKYYVHTPHPFCVTNAWTYIKPRGGSLLKKWKFLFVSFLPKLHFIGNCWKLAYKVIRKNVPIFSSLRIRPYPAHTACI